MSWAATALQVYGTLAQGQAQKKSLNYNAGVMSQEQSAALNESNVAEGQLRRNSRESLGREAAAFGSAGVGYGGSSESALRTSAFNQEMDALNTRYRGALTSYGYGAQSQIDKYEAGQAGANSQLLAGAALLKGLGPYYSTSGANATTGSPEFTGE